MAGSYDQKVSSPARGERVAGFVEQHLRAHPGLTLMVGSGWFLVEWASRMFDAGERLEIWARRARHSRRNR